MGGAVKGGPCEAEGGGPPPAREKPFPGRQAGARETGGPLSGGRSLHPTLAQRAPRP